MKRVRREDLKRACSMYRTDTQASQALRISNEWFKAKCREFHFETPTQRLHRELEERKERQKQNKARGITILFPARSIPFPVHSKKRNSPNR